MARPTFGSLFAGIGGIDLGLERAGWTGRWQVEWDPFCQHVLAHHWPDVVRYSDIRRVDWSSVEPVDLIAGGFPCQPISSAGRQRAQDDPRWLWPEFARAVSVLRPRYVLVENVRNLLRVNGGTALGEVLGDLDSLGYDTERHIISAAAVGAPHRRDRLWIVAHDPNADSRGRPLDAQRDSGRQVGPGASALGHDADRLRSPVAHAHGEPWRQGWARDAEQRPRGRDAGGGGVGSPVADADEERRRRRAGELGPVGWTEPADGGEDVADAHESRLQGLAGDVVHGPWREGPDGPAAAPGVLAGSRSAEWWATEPDVGRVAHGVPARVDRLRALGNAVVPQIPEILGRLLLRHMSAAIEEAA